MEALQTALMTAVSTILVAFVGIITQKVVVFLNEKGITDKLIKKKEIVRTVVYAVEQIYADASGPKKLAHAKEFALKELEQNGIEISPEELSIFIESVVAEFNKYSKDTLHRALEGARMMSLEEDI